MRFLHLSLAPGKRRCRVQRRVLNAPGRHHVEIKKSSLDNLCMSGSDLEARKLLQQYAVFTLTPNLSNLIVTNPVLGKNLEHPLLTR